MAKGKKSRGNKGKGQRATFADIQEQLKSEITPQIAEVVDAKAPIPPTQDTTVSISLKFYDHKLECFSIWDAVELRAFSSLIEKLRGRTWLQAKITELAHAHKGKPSRMRPFSISNDVLFYRLKLGQTTRIHGFEFESVFYLVWLDKNHRYHSA